MSDKFEVFQIVVASPSDCQEERASVRDLLIRWNDVHGGHQNVELKPVLWELDVRPELGYRPQEIINRQIIDKADALIAIFWTRLGTATGVAPSGTVEEIDRFVQSGRPALVYFSNRPADPTRIETDQLLALRAFKQQVQGKGIVGEFRELSELRDKVERHVGSLPERIRQAAPPPGSESERAPRQHEQQYAIKNPEISAYDLVFETSNAVQFYNEIAERYDARQSDELLETQYAVIRAARRTLSGRDRATVLDLGGGTGAEIGTHFAPRDQLRWVYVDLSGSMVHLFSRNLRKAHMKTTIILGDAEEQAEFFIEEGNRFDLVIMSWLLSSLPRSLSIEKLVPLLKADGRLIIADAHPQNLKARPLYGVSLGEKRVALRLRSVLASHLDKMAERAGLIEAEEPVTVQGPENTHYSFVRVYRLRDITT